VIETVLCRGLFYLLTYASELPWKQRHKQCGSHWLVSCVCFGETGLKRRIEVGVYLQSILFEYCWSFTRVCCVEDSPTDGDDVGILSEFFAIDVKAVPRPDAVELSVDWGSIRDIWVSVKLFMVVWPWSMSEAPTGGDTSVGSSEPRVVLVQDVKRSIIDESLQTLVDYVVKPSAADNTAQRWTTTVFRNASSVLRWVPACMCRHACMWLPCSMLLTVTRHLQSPQSCLLMTDVTYCGVRYFLQNLSDRWRHESSCKPNRLARSVGAY